MALLVRAYGTKTNAPKTKPSPSQTDADLAVLLGHGHSSCLTITPVRIAGYLFLHGLDAHCVQFIQIDMLWAVKAKLSAAPKLQAVKREHSFDAVGRLHEEQRAGKRDNYSLPLVNKNDGGKGGNSQSPMTTDAQVDTRAVAERRDALHNLRPRWPVEISQ